MTTPAERARNYFDQTYNCSQSVFSAFTPLQGIDEKTALRLAAPFGGGFARQGHVCGAVTGALLVLGLTRGKEIPAGKGEIYTLSQEFIRRFEAKHGSLLCRSLIDFDISTPEGYQNASESGVFKKVCPRLIETAVEVVQEMLEPSG